MALKTMKGWVKSNKDLSKYLAIGDTIDEELQMYFIETLPPEYMQDGIIQMGEPFTHIQGKPTYATIQRRKGAAGTDDKWVYCGHCFLGETTDPTHVAEQHYFDITKINWRKLTEQKRAFIRQIDLAKSLCQMNRMNVIGDSIEEADNNQQKLKTDIELLEGLLQVIEDMQDCGVDTCGVPKWMVFGPLVGDECKMPWFDTEAQETFWDNHWTVTDIDLETGQVTAKRTSDPRTINQGCEVETIIWELWYKNQ
jgi:hypothetical protein